ncbi:MAG: CRISPR-associated protein Cas4 [Sulfolobales archaeon]|nr:CRISPR-associated protein Cas4 [Sulfolobales archaeon]MCX8208478.1 CRISPR-associated protein Cas4 [Sulfolobales archaeon]MDW8010998.1 CRISPR-associated protein Cas4 [Sulfolobales archaeon]
MATVRNYVTSADVKEYVYCPAIVWIRHVLNVEEPQDFNMAFGRSKSYRLDVLERVGVRKPWSFEVFLRNPSKGIAGVVDVVGGSGRFEVVELKAFRRRSFSHFKSQLMFHAYLVSTTMGPVTRAYLVLDDRVRAYVVNETATRDVERIIEGVRRVRESERPPRASRSWKCRLCWYRRYCPSA